MKRIILSLYSPAPYWDNVISEIRKEFSVDIVYETKKDIEKDWKKLNCYNGLFYNDLSFVRLYKILSKYDCIIFNRWCNYKNIILGLILIAFKKNVCYMSDYPENKKRTIIKETIKRLLIKYSKVIIAMSESTKNYYENKYKECQGKTIVIPYIFSTINNIEEIKEYNNKRENHLVSEKIPIKLFISTRFIERKGYNVVANSFDILKQKGLINNFDITIAGNGPLFDLYKVRFSSISSQIKLIGWIEIDEYINHMDMTDVFLHPSLFEPFGIPPIDAMARGKLYIGTNKVMSTNNYIINGINGFQYEYNSSDDLAQILIYINNNRTCIYNIGRKGMEDTLRYYSGEIIRAGVNKVISLCK